MSKGTFVGEFELVVLLALVHLGRDGYGLAIKRFIHERTGRDVSIGAVYATLGRLSDKHLVTSRFSDPQPVQGGRSRRMYRLTAQGERALALSTRMLTLMLTGAGLPGVKR